MAARMFSSPILPVISGEMSSPGGHWPCKRRAQAGCGHWTARSAAETHACNFPVHRNTLWGRPLHKGIFPLLHQSKYLGFFFFPPIQLQALFHDAATALLGTSWARSPPPTSPEGRANFFTHSYSLRLCQEGAQYFTSPTRVRLPGDMIQDSFLHGLA